MTRGLIPSSFFFFFFKFLLDFLYQTINLFYFWSFLELIVLYITLDVGYTMQAILYYKE